MEDNIIKTDKGTIIISGGNGLNDCPKDWDEAHKWEKNANVASVGDYDKPKWEFDCGFKLDYDGTIMQVCSRFYPPKTHSGKTWDGYITLYIFDKEVHKEKFDCKTIEELKQNVEAYILGVRAKIEGLF